MISLQRHIPNTITCGNLLCGCLALVKAFEGDLVWAGYLVGIALVLDFLDGFMARLLKVQSAIGKDLDSLADMVTFGVVPGVVLFKVLQVSIGQYAVDGPAQEGWTIYPPSMSKLVFLGFILTIFSAIRLAKFNNDTRQTDSFIGLPTPANAIFFCSLPLILESNLDSYYFLLNPILLILLTIVFSLLMISEIPLFSLKFKSFGWRGNEMPFVFLALSVILIFSLKYVAIPLLIVLYILLSIVNNIFLKKKV